MKAIRVRSFGGPEVLQMESLDVPDPGPGEVRIRVHDIGVEIRDGLARGLLRPLLGRLLRLDQASDAHRSVMEPGAFGKILLLPTP